MKKSLTFGIHLLIASAISPNVNASTVKQYSQLVEQWLSLNQQNSQLMSDWQLHKPVLEQRLSLLKQEQIQLVARLKQSKNQQDEVTLKRNHILNKQSQLESEQEVLTNWLKQEVSKLHNRLLQLPPPLKTSWQHDLAQYEISQSNSEKLELLLVLQKKRTEFNERVTFEKSKIRLTQNDERLIEQLYFGEKLAYFSTPDGSQTGIGYIKDKKWFWQLGNSISYAQFQSAKAMLQHKEAASFIAMPVILEQTR